MNPENDLRRLNRALQTISACNYFLVRAQAEQPLLDSVCRTLVEEGGYRMAWVGYAEKSDAKRVRPVAHAGHEDGYLSRIVVTWAADALGHGPTGTAIRTGLPAVNRNTRADAGVSPWRVEALKRGYLSSIGLPLRAGSEVFGALSIYAAEPDVFDTEEMKLLSRLADDLAFGVETIRLRAERRKAEEILREQAQEIDELYEKAPWGYHSLGPDGTYLRINNTELKWLGYTREEIVGKLKFADLVTPQSRHAFHEKFAIFLEVGEVRDLEYEMVRKDGSILPILLSATAVRDSAGKFLFSRATVFDVTERKRAEKMLRLTQFSLEHASDSVFWIDCQGRFVYVNEAACRSLDRSRSEVLSLSVPDIDPVFSLEKWRVLWETVKARGSITLETCHRTKGGKVFPAEVTCNYLKFGGKEYAFAFARDISERKKAEEALQVSERELAQAMDMASLAHWELDTAAMMFTFNDRFYALYGTTGEREGGYQMSAETYAREFLPPEEVHIVADEIAKALATPDPNASWLLDHRIRRRDGEIRHIVVRISVIKDSQGRTIKTRGVNQDITERRRADQALAASEARFRSYFELPLIGMAITSVEKGFVAVNDRICAILGYSRDELMQLDWATLTHPDDLATDEFQFNRVLSGEIDGYSLDKRFIRKDGEIIWASIAVRCVRKADGTVDYICAVLQDITERKHANEKIKQSEEKFRKAFMTAADGIYISTLKEGKLLEVNDRFGDIFGYHREEMIGKTYLELGYMNPADRQKLAAEVRSKGQVRDMELPFRRKGGEPITAVVSANVLDSSKEQLMLGVVRDVTEQKRTHESLVRLHQAVDASGEVIFMTDRECVFTFVNPEFTRLYGYEEAEVVGRATPRILKSGAQPPEKYVQFWNTLLAKRVARGRIVNKTKDGRLLTIQGSVSPILNETGNITGFLAIQRDLTEHQRLEAQFIHAQKMEAVGRLAAGVAHDFNNLLTIINGHCGLMLKQLPSDDPARESFTDIKDAGERAAALTRQLLAFSRQEVRTSTVLDLNALVANSIKMLRRLIGEDIELVFDPVPDLGLVCADPGQIEQVLMNLAVNSRDAMPKGGKLSIDLSNFQADESFAASHYPMPSGAYIRLAVSDNGCGMDAKTQSRIFEPFFTTKEPGKGTGLGLATAYGIVKQNGGYIWVYSELGKGTTFKVYLPAVEGRAEATEALGNKASGSETVLLVEDESKVRSLARRMLESEGYKVLEASGGMEALLLASQHKGPIHMLLTDVVMPVMSGRELAQRLAKLHPQIKILYMSGYTDDTIVRHGVLEAGVAFLQKPFAPEVLARKVRAVLDA